MADYNISAVRRRAVFSGSAGAGPYSCTFEILTQTDIKVYKNTSLLTLTTDYTVTINANGTFSVTLVVAATGSDTVTVAGARDIARTTDFVTAGDLRASALNEQLDALTIFDQQMYEQGERSVRFPITDSTSLSAVLPIAATRANKVMAFDANGNVTTSTETLANIEGAATSAAAAAASASAASGSASAASASASAAATSAANLPNATTAGASKYIKSNSGGTGWDYPSSIVGTDVDAATASARGSVELATPAEAQTGTDTARAVTPEGLKATVSQIPVNSQNGAGYTAVLADAGKAIMKAAADTSARTFTIPANASVAYEIGTCLTFINEAASGNITIAITSDTLVLSSAGTTGSRTLAPYGMATAIKVTATKWMISGTGLT